MILLKAEREQQRNSIARNIIHLFYSTALTSVLNATALIVLAYYLHSYYYGIFSVILAFAMIMGYFTDAGLSSIVLREGSKEDTDRSIVISSYVKLRVAFLIGTFLLGFMLIVLTHSSNREIILSSFFLILPMVTGIAMQSIGTTYFQLIEQMQYHGYIRIVSALCLVLSLAMGMLFSLHPYVLFFLYGFSYLMAGLYSLYLVSRHIKIILKAPFHKGLLQGIGPFVFGGFLFIILPHLGPIILEKTVSLEEVGFFALAYRIPQSLQQISLVVAGAYYPVLFRHFNNNQLIQHTRYSMRQIKSMALLGMMMTIPFYHLSEIVIEVLFGQGWEHAAAPLKILALMLTFQAINLALADGLTTRGLQAYRTIVQSIAVGAGIILYYYLSLYVGIIGAAYTGVIIETIALVGFSTCNPERRQIMSRVIVPYGSFFLLSFGLFEYVLHSSSIIATLLHTCLLVLLFILDKEVSHTIYHYLQPRVLFEKWRKKSY